MESLEQGSLSNSGIETDLLKTIGRSSSMGLTMQQRHPSIRQLAPRFPKASKMERSKILDEFVSLSGYTRSSAAFVLCTCGKRHLKILDGGRRRIVFVVGHCRAAGAKRQRRR
jgi:hypothetical protein